MEEGAVIGKRKQIETNLSTKIRRAIYGN